MHPTACDYLLDVAQNAFEAGARRVRLRLRRVGARLAAEISDDGCGMDEATLRAAVNPFATDGRKHPGRKVGLGLPFVKQAAEQCGGTFAVDSRQGCGTTVRFAFDLANVDAPPLGDVPGTLTALMNGAGACELDVEREEDGRRYSARRSELAEALDGLRDAGALALLKRFFAENEAEISREVQDGKTDVG
jgi:hypothetical protein